MNCKRCGAENQQGTLFCGQCGTSLSDSSVPTEDSSVPTEDSSVPTEDSSVPTEFDWTEFDGTENLVVRPSQWAWGVYAVPLVVIYALLMSVDVFTFGLLPVAVLAAFIVPRYITWRGSAYTITQDSLIIKRGQLGRQDEVPVLFAEIDSFEERQGFLGPTLQYTSVHVFLEDGRQGVLSYVPVDSGIMDRLAAEGIRYGAPGSDEDEEDSEEISDSE